LQRRRASALLSVTGMEGTRSEFAAALLGRVQHALAEAERAVVRSEVLRTATRLVREPGSMVTRCAWCSNLMLGGRWLAQESVPPFLVDYVEVNGTHGICPGCLEELQVTGHSKPLR
jgi:hypothetical protein